MNPIARFFKAFNHEETEIEYDFYYVLTGKVVGVQKSDGDAYHPFIAMTACKRIGKLQFWTFAFLNIAGLIILGISYNKKRKIKKN